MFWKTTAQLVTHVYLFRDTRPARQPTGSNLRHHFFLSLALDWYGFDFRFPLCSVLRLPLLSFVTYPRASSTLCFSLQLVQISVRISGPSFGVYSCTPSSESWVLPDRLKAFLIPVFSSVTFLPADQSLKSVADVWSALAPGLALHEKIPLFFCWKWNTMTEK